MNGPTTARRRLLAITTGTLEGPATLEELRGRGDDEIELRVVVPAVEATSFRHTLGDIDEPREEAEKRVAAILASLRRHDIEAAGEVGDPDPVQAAQDALLKAPADEVVIFERQDAQARWFEAGLFDRAKAAIEPPLRLVVLDEEPDGSQQPVAEERFPQGTVNPDEGKEIGSAYLPGLSRGDFAGMVIGVFGHHRRDSPRCRDHRRQRLTGRLVGSRDPDRDRDNARQYGSCGWSDPDGERSLSGWLRQVLSHPGPSGDAGRSARKPLDPPTHLNDPATAKGEADAATRSEKGKQTGPSVQAHQKE